MKKDVIGDFMKGRDLPDWFRGLSKFQRKAADSLFNAIRDDSQQATSHRVRDALARIGIEPLVGPSKIKFVMNLSGGNDICFLWFLMEMYYRNSHFNVRKKYSVNEQILISVIAYLDTIPTLRELDKLLPKKPEKSKKTKKPIRKKKVKPVIIFPYFEKQNRPILYGKKLTMQHIANPANFSELKNFLDPNLIIINEANRWFANYKLKKSDRIATRILKNKITNLFEANNQTLNKKGSSSKIARQIVRKHIDTLFKGANQEDKNLNLCAHHKTQKKIKESLANEMELAKRKANAKYFDVIGHFKNKSLKRISKDLNAEIEKVTEEIKANSSPNTTEKDEVPPEVDNESLYNLGHDAPLNSKCIYFKGPTSNKPYKFNYDKIFDLGARNPIKDAIASALNAESSGNVSMEQSRAIKKCCKEIWTQEVKNHNLNIKNKSKSEKEENESELKPVDYNPRDKELMKSILLTALNELKKNKKFVLPSLPDAHKIPTIREWVRHRYGNVYTIEERKKTYMDTKRVFHYLRTHALHLRIPHIDDLSKNRVVSYGCKDYLLRKTNYINKVYRDKFKETFLEYSRVFWAAIRPFQCSQGPPRNVFFAYIPARKNTINVFRPWKATEYIHAKEEWDRRQRKQRPEHNIKYI